MIYHTERVAVKQTHTGRDTINLLYIFDHIIRFYCILYITLLYIYIGVAHVSKHVSKYFAHIS